MPRYTLPILGGPARDEIAACASRPCGELNYVTFRSLAHPHQPPSRSLTDAYDASVTTIREGVANYIHLEGMVFTIFGPRKFEAVYDEQAKTGELQIYD